MAYELMDSTVISVCVDCVYFNAYGRLDDMTMGRDRQATDKHRAMIAEAGWPWGTEFTSGCGQGCPDRESDGTGGCSGYFIDPDGDLQPDDNAEPEPWFSWSACDQCGSPLGGDREHATAWTYRKQSEWEFSL